jgi:hypothetical protein
LFNSTRLLETVDTGTGGFYEEVEPVNQNIIPTSIILDSNKGKLNYSILTNAIDIFVQDGKVINFTKDDPLEIHFEYRIKEFVKYDVQKQLYYIYQPFLQYISSEIPNYYNLNVKVIFPFDLYPTSGPSYIPFLCYPNEEMSQQENFNISLLQETPPILQFSRTSYKEGEDLSVESYFDLLAAPPKMNMYVTENLNLDTGGYGTDTKVTNFYPHELCYALSKENNSIKIAIQDCNKINTHETTNYYHLDPNETSADFSDNGYGNKDLCSESILENFYPFECFIINKNVPIETNFYPERLQKDIIIHYRLEMTSSKGFINKSFNLSLLPDIIARPNTAGFDCRAFKPFEYPDFKVRNLGYSYSASLDSKIFQPTFLSTLRYSISVVRSPIRVWLPMFAAFLPYIAAFLIARYLPKKNRIYYYLLSFFGIFIGMFGLSLNLGATPEDFFQLKSLPLILLMVNILIVLLIEFKKKNNH